MYGTAQFGLPTLTNDRILRLRAGLEALYDYRGQFVRVTLILTEALVCKRVRLFTGGIGHNPPQESPREFAKAVIDAARIKPA